MATGLYYSDACLKHDTGGHPESAQRLEAIMGRLRSLGDLPGLSLLEAPAAGLELVERVHTPGLVKRVLREAERGGGWLDPDTVVSPGSVEAALHAVGGTVEATVAVATGKLENGFVAVRPPGHHATPDRAMGFCLFNNVAIAARQLLDRGLAGRIAIVDFDVHHGNGTQEVFYQEPSVLYFSTHQMPLFPGTGRHTETGRGPGEGYTVNAPLPPGVGDEGYLYLFESVLAPLLRRYRPELLLVSAGYDPHWRDPLASMRVTVPGFRRMAAELQGLARDLCGGKAVYVLEGGYDLAALGCAVEATVRLLCGDGKETEDPYGPPPSSLGREAVEPIVAAVRGIHRL
ncbi:MAG: histone deacetylase family protein [Chloroflexota bacterium]